MYCGLKSLNVSSGSPLQQCSSAFTPCRGLCFPILASGELKHAAEGMFSTLDNLVKSLSDKNYYMAAIRAVHTGYLASKYEEIVPCELLCLMCCVSAPVPVSVTGYTIWSRTGKAVWPRQCCCIR